MKINIGCGQSPTAGWKNFDNSKSVRLARRPLSYSVMKTLRLVSPKQKAFVDFAKEYNIEWADATERIPVDTDAADVVYASHMLEHLDPTEVTSFLKEAHRVLKPGGILRLAVPNLRFHIDNYLASCDANLFVKSLNMSIGMPRSFPERIRFLLTGYRKHRWMYDGDSLCQLLSDFGFKDSQVVTPGTTRITDPGSLNLYERVPESVFVEAFS